MMSLSRGSSLDQSVVLLSVICMCYLPICISSICDCVLCETACRILRLLYSTPIPYIPPVEFYTVQYYRNNARDVRPVELYFGVLFDSQLHFCGSGLGFWSPVGLSPQRSLQSDLIHSWINSDWLINSVSAPGIS